MATTRSRAWFPAFARLLSLWAGRPGTFAVAFCLVLAWALSGPFFHYSDTWQLVINTATTVITFLMVFLIQNTQDRDTRAIQLKLDELIRGNRGAHNSLIDLEDLDDEALAEHQARYAALAREARKMLDSGTRDMGTPALPRGKGPRRARRSRGRGG